MVSSHLAVLILDRLHYNASYNTIGLSSGCFACLVDAAGLDCLTCLEPCLESFYQCSGLPVISSNSTQNLAETAASPAENFCHDFDLQSVEEWYTAYELTFIGSVRDSWTSGAKFLTVVIVIFSGIWPYLKNVILAIVWYIPMSVESQTSVLLWLSRLSKYTLVDVFLVIGVFVGIQLQLKIGTIDVIMRGEPR